MNPPRLVAVSLLAVIALALALAFGRSAPASADEGWVILSFEAHYTINPDGTVLVTEDILVDFRGLQRHGIFREIPVEYRYDPDPYYRRHMPITVHSVDNGTQRHKYETSRVGANLRIKIGDPDLTVTGRQRYRITYTVRGALNAFEASDELYWNATGNDWSVRIESALVVVEAPSISRVTCFEGRRGSDAPCRGALLSTTSASFLATRSLAPSEGLTFVVELPKGAVAVGAPILKPAPGLPAIREAAGLKPAPIAASILVGVLAFGAVGRLWWLGGRDRWLGDVHYLTGATAERRKPLFARETVVVEYTPPELPKTRRRLRPAEIGVLLDERADTLDVSATIVDLAVRGYLVVTDEGKKDWQMELRREADAELRPYEKRLLNALFQSETTVRLKDLKDSFYTDLAKVKQDLYKESVRTNHFFPTNPETVRAVYKVVGFMLAGAGVAATYILGLFSVGVVGVPLVLAGLGIVVISNAMPHRTGIGREMYRRSLGFREFMETAETDKQRFYEEENIFDKYLPYAIVFGSTRKWAKAFQGIESQPGEHSWYRSPMPFVATSFIRDVESFSSSVSSAISSTPSSSGSSGFSGGSSGGGGGGGGGGSW